MQSKLYPFVMSSAPMKSRPTDCCVEFSCSSRIYISHVIRAGSHLRFAWILLSWLVGAVALWKRWCQGSTYRTVCSSRAFGKRLVRRGSRTAAPAGGRWAGKTTRSSALPACLGPAERSTWGRWERGSCLRARERGGKRRLVLTVRVFSRSARNDLLPWRLVIVRTYGSG